MVPIYLGDASHLKSLLPHTSAAIFISDYDKNYTRLSEYLLYLSRNESAYEEHRLWRVNFSSTENSRKNALLRNSWYCRTCQYAADIANNKRNKIIATTKEDATNYNNKNKLRSKPLALRDHDMCTDIFTKEKKEKSVF